MSASPSNPGAWVAVTPVSDLQAPFLSLCMYILYLQITTFLIKKHNSSPSLFHFIITISMSDNSEVPRWLYALLNERFFNGCIIHDGERKNEKNVFCFDCCQAFCPYCLVGHASHRLLQIRRYMYHDVIRIREAEKLMDCAQVQFYKTNSAKVVFLNQRPPTRPCKSNSSFCINCDKSLQNSYIFCCLSCKLEYLVATGRRLPSYIRNCDFVGMDDGQLTPDSVLELSGSMAGSGLLASATSEIIRKKRSHHQPRVRSVFAPVSEAVMNRRKGTPHRSPLY